MPPYFLFCLAYYEAALAVAFLYAIGEHTRAIFLFHRLMTG